MGPLDIPDQEYDLNGSTQQFDTRPVLLLSTERSGSNLVRSILNTHPEITAPHPIETAFPWRNMSSPTALSSSGRRSLVRDVLINKEHSHHPLVEELNVDRIHSRIESADPQSFLTVQEALYNEYAEVTGADLWVSKDPSIWDYLDELREYYDDLAVVYLVRDARDVTLSFKNSTVGQYHPYFSAQRWADEQAVGIGLLDSSFGESVFTLQYEHLLENPETVAESLCNFLGTEYAPEMLYFYDTEDAQRAAESAGALENLSVPIQSDNCGKYRDGLTGRELKLVEQAAGEELTYFDYELETDESEREAVDIDIDEFEQTERDLSQLATLSAWREDTEEQIRRSATRSFSIYMILRYGLLG